MGEHHLNRLLPSRPPHGIDARHATGVDGVPPRRDLDSVSAPSTCKTTGTSGSALAGGVHADAIVERTFPQHDLGRDRHLRLARAHSASQRLIKVTGASVAPCPCDRWRSLARSLALNRTNGWRSGPQILTVGHERAVFVATSGQFCWPPTSSSDWPLTDEEAAYRASRAHIQSIQDRLIASGARDRDEADAFEH